MYVGRRLPFRHEHNNVIDAKTRMFVLIEYSRNMLMFSQQLQRSRKVVDALILGYIAQIINAAYIKHLNSEITVWWTLRESIDDTAALVLLIGR